MHQIVLIRHGEAAKSPANADPGLTGLGQQQAGRLADSLQRQFPEGEGVRLISSPKSRALQTAMPIATRWHRHIEEATNVIEIPSPQGLPLAERGNWTRQLIKGDWDSLSPEQIQWRKGVMDFLLQLEEPVSDKIIQADTTLVFCHFMVINSAVANIRNSCKVAQFHPDYTSQTHLSIHNGLIEIIELGKEKTSKNIIQ